jgi:anti-sigma factor RsiW
MKIPRAWMTRANATLLIGAYLDGELDAAASLQVEQMIAADPASAAECDRLAALRLALATHRPDPQVPDALLQTITAIGLSAPEPRLPRRFTLTQMAASILLAMAVSASGTWAVLTHDFTSTEIAGVVMAHQAALLAPEPFQVASNDTHTVKPWFDVHVALSPQVSDLTAAGYPLTGGRIDRIDDRPVPVVVYKRRAHVISLVAEPAPGSHDDARAVTQDSRDGYLVLSWPGRDFTYRAVSDLAAPELRDFVALWRAQGG